MTQIYLGRSTNIRGIRKNATVRKSQRRRTYLVQPGQFPVVLRTSEFQATSRGRRRPKAGVERDSEGHFICCQRTMQCLPGESQHQPRPGTDCRVAFDFEALSNRPHSGVHMMEVLFILKQLTDDRVSDRYPAFVSRCWNPSGWLPHRGDIAITR